MRIKYNLYPLSKNVICFILFFSCVINLPAQPPSTRQKVLINSNQRKIITVSDGINVNNDVLHLINKPDTVWNLKPYLQTKASCDYKKTLDDNGCVIVKYADGFMKKICDTTVCEVTLPSGKKYVQRALPSVRLEVTPIPPPPNPSATETNYNWITKYNETLLKDIKTFLGNDAGYIQKYLQKESSVCKGFIYKQIEYRTIFIEEFLKAQ